MINSITDEDLVASESSEAPEKKSAKKSKAQEELPDY